jgi:acyl carrier protein
MNLLDMKVKRMISEQLGVSEDMFADARLREDLGASADEDDLDVIELVMSLEEEFNIEIPDKEDVAAKLATVGDVIDYVQQHGG